MAELTEDKSGRIVKKKWTPRDITYTAVMTGLIAVCSWISIPAAVPFTLQTFAVYLTLELLGGRRGTFSVLVYLLLGALGLPVFSGFSGGVGVLFGPTGGYILGFLGLSLLYWGFTTNFGKKLPVRIVAMILGLAVCYTFGTVWFLIVYTHTTGPVGLTTILGWCVFPFILPDLIKLTLAVVLAGRLTKHMRK